MDTSPKYGFHWRRRHKSPYVIMKTGVDESSSKGTSDASLLRLVLLFALSRSRRLTQRRNHKYKHKKMELDLSKYFLTIFVLVFAEFAYIHHITLTHPSILLASFVKTRCYLKLSFIFLSQLWLQIPQQETGSNL